MPKFHGRSLKKIYIRSCSGLDFHITAYMIRMYVGLKHVGNLHTIFVSCINIILYIPLWIHHAGHLCLGTSYEIRKASHTFSNELFKKHFTSTSCFYYVQILQASIRSRQLSFLLFRSNFILFQKIDASGSIRVANSVSLSRSQLSLSGKTVF